MDSISYTTARANLAKTMDRVCESHEPVIITRSGDSSVVMLSLEDFNSLEETAYLLRSLPEKAKAWEDLVFARNALRSAAAV